MIASETRLTAIGSSATWATSFYGFDGHGSVRLLMDSSGNVTDTYDYDAFGILIHQTGSTPNVYLYSGEQFDPDLGLYYQRARYLSTATGRFWTADTFEGFDRDPRSLHKYLFGDDNPVNRTDPTGRFSIIETLQVLWARLGLFTLSVISNTAVRIAFAGLAIYAAATDPGGFITAYLAGGGNLGDLPEALVADTRSLLSGARGALRSSQNVVTLTYNTGDLVDFYYKTDALSDAANNGRLIVLEGTDSVRSPSAQRAYRNSVFKAYVNDLVDHFGIPRAKAIEVAKGKFKSLDVDHLIDLQVSRALSNPNDPTNLGLLNNSVNRSVGKQLQLEIDRLGLEGGDKIDQVVVNAPPRPQ